MSARSFVRAVSAAILALAFVVPAEASGESTGATEPTHWSYAGATGPEDWGSLSPDFATCATGMGQSPVDIPVDAPINPDDVTYAYADTAVEIVNNGHAIQVDYDEGGTVGIDGTTYALRQLHFHSPSEHTLGGEHAAMEMHLVHTDAQGTVAVIGVLLVEGDANPAFDPIWDQMPATEGTSVAISDAFVEPTDLLPADRSYYAYEGSLTTPPCTEGVRWHVLTRPVELSAGQVAAFRDIHDGTNRPVRSMNEREFERP